MRITNCIIIARRERTIRLSLRVTNASLFFLHVSVSVGNVWSGLPGEEETRDEGQTVYARFAGPGVCVRLLGVR
jgi:hypothetical protein